MPALHPELLTVRGAAGRSRAQLGERPGHLRLHAVSGSLAEIAPHAFAGFRLEQSAATLETVVEMPDAAPPGMLAGLALRHSEHRHLTFGVRAGAILRVVELVLHVGGEDRLLGRSEVPAGRVDLLLEIDGFAATARFEHDGQRVDVGSADLVPLSPSEGGGFAGVVGGAFVVAAPGAGAGERDDAAMTWADFDLLSLVHAAAPDPDLIGGGGAIDPVTTPVALAEGTGDVAALTFDDGPDPGTTPALLDFLAERDVRAVFCVVGRNITAPGGAAILRRIVAEGHVLGNHSTGHADLGSWSAARVRADLTENLAIIRDALGDPDHPVPFWRAPNGNWGASQQVAVELGMQPLAVVNTIDDWQTQDVATLTSNLRTAMRPGEIVLAHDGGGDRAGTLAAVQAIVTERLADGWSFVFPKGTPPVANAAATPAATPADRSPRR